MYGFLFTSCRRVYRCVRNDWQLCLVVLMSSSFKFLRDILKEKSLINNYTPATEENVGNIPVCTCCKHFPIS